MRFVLLLLLPATVLAFDPDPVARDLALARRLARQLPPTGAPEPARLPDSLEPAETEWDQPLAAGARRLRVRFRGGRGRLRVTLVARGDRVLAVDVHHEVRSVDAARVRDAWERPGMEAHEDHLSWSWRDADGLAAWAAARAAELGEPEPLDGAGEEVRAAVARLTDPMERLVYGRMAGYAGLPPPGREAIATLRKAGARAAIRNVARGPNPAGRLYAAGALLAGDGPRDDTERRLVAAARAQEASVVWARGCVHVERPAAEALAAELAD